MSDIMTKKNKNKLKLEIPKDLLAVKKSVVEKFAPENKPIEKVQDIKAVDKNLESVKSSFVDEREFLEYMDQAIKNTIKAGAKSKGKQMDEVFKTLDHIMPEFFDSCIIFGFTPLGERCVYMLANTEKDKEAVFHHVKSVVYNMGNQ